MTRFLACSLALLGAGCLGDYNKVCDVPCTEGNCQPESVAQSPAESIAVVLFQGTRPLYSTGYGAQIREAVPGSVEGNLIADSVGFPCFDGTDTCYITDLAVDDTRVYWTQYNGNEVWSINPDTPLEGAIRHASNPGFAAAYGRIALSAEHIYWVTEAVDGGDPGGIWRTDRDAEDETASGFSTDDTPHGIAVDDTYVYWTDQQGGRIRRVSHDAFEDDPPVIDDLVENLIYPNDLQVVGDTLYVIDMNVIYSVPKTGGEPTQVGTGAGNGWTLQIVGDHAYWTDETAIRRAKLDGSQDLTLASGLDNPRGMAVGCELYYATYPSSGEGAAVFKLAK